MQQILNYAEKLVSESLIAKLGIATIAGIVEYLLPQQINREMIVAVGLLILLDLITGITLALQNKRLITSKAFSQTLVKCIGYGAVIGMTALLVKNISMFDDISQPTLTSVLTLILLTEALSVLENVNAMGIKLPFGLNKRLKRKLSELRDEEGDT